MTSELKIGLAPVRRNGFPESNAAESRDEIVRFFGGTGDSRYRLVNSGTVSPNGMLSTADHADRAVEYLRRESVDAVFIPHCDFGEESVVAAVAKGIGKPVLIWGPRDAAPDPVTGRRKRDTQCGLFASTKVLQRYGIPFSYIVNSSIDSPEFASGFDTFLGTVSVVKTFHSIRIAQISNRPRPFFSVMANEAELLERFGIEVVPVNVPDLLREVENVKNRKGEQIREGVGNLEARIDTDKMTPGKLENLVALRIAVEDLLTETGCNTAAIECWSMLPKVLDVRPCFVVGELSGAGVPIACETDLHGAVSALLLQASSLHESPTFFADLTIRHPSNDNAELLWHCGPFPYVLKDPDSPAALDEGMGQWKLKDGDITIARFDSLGGEYRLLAGEAHTTTGPMSEGTYVWIETDEWERWEKKFIYGPYIHHVAGSYGSFASILAESCRFIPGLEADSP